MYHCIYLKCNCNEKPLYFVFSSVSLQTIIDPRSYILLLILVINSKMFFYWSSDLTSKFGFFLSQIWVSRLSATVNSAWNEFSHDFWTASVYWGHPRSSEWFCLFVFKRIFPFRKLSSNATNLKSYWSFEISKLRLFQNVPIGYSHM